MYTHMAGEDWLSTEDATARPGMQAIAARLCQTFLVFFIEMSINGFSCRPSCVRVC